MSIKIVVLFFVLIAMQDKELRQQHSQIQQLQERAGAPPPSTTNEIQFCKTSSGRVGRSQA